MKGTFLMSFDVELAWGFVVCVEIKERHLKPVRGVREALDPLLKIIGDYKIPASWAIVGHLFLDRCECRGRPHPEMPRPNYGWFEGDWYKYDPCSDVKSDPLWYGKDVVEKILDFAKKSSTEQDICCHSFSHPIFGFSGCSEEVAKAEIDKSREVMMKYGVNPTVFVFPLGSAGHLNVLREKGFVVFRGGISEFVQRYANFDNPTEKFLRRYFSFGLEFLSYYFHLPPPVVVPRQVLPGLWEVPGSMSFNKKRNVPMRLVVSKVKRGIERAIREKKCFHLFTHLHNFGIDSDIVLREFEKVLAFADKKRKEGKLQMATMKDFADDIRGLN